MFDVIARLTDDFIDDDIREAADELEGWWNAVRANPAFLPAVVLVGSCLTAWLLTRAWH